MARSSDERTNERADTPVDWSRVGLDWIDLVIIVGFSSILTLLFTWIGWWPPRALLGIAFASPLIAALFFRRKVLPPVRRGLVKQRFSVIGIVATMLMLFGLLVGLFGALGMSLQLSTEPHVVNEADVKSLARARASAEAMPEIVGTVSAAEAAKHGGDGTFEDLMAELEKGPSEEVVARYEVEVRRELEAEAEARAKEQSSGAIGFGLKAALLAIGMIALGGWLDARRPREPVST